MAVNKRLVVWCVLLALHGAVSAWTMWVDGYVAIFTVTLSQWASAQVFSDLCVALFLVCSWMLYDARTSGVPAWPFVLVTPALGSFGPLGYLVARELRRPA